MEKFPLNIENLIKKWVNYAYIWLENYRFYQKYPLSSIVFLPRVTWKQPQAGVSTWHAWHTSTNFPSNQLNEPYKLGFLSDGFQIMAMLWGRHFRPLHSHDSLSKIHKN